MNRRKFFKSLAIGVAATIVAPKLLELSPKPDGYTVNKPMVHGIKLSDNIIGYDTGRGIFWIRKAEWDSQKSWYDTQEQIMIERMKQYMYKL